MKRASARYYEESETRHYPVHAKLANHLIAALIDRRVLAPLGMTSTFMPDRGPDGRGGLSPAHSG